MDPLQDRFDRVSDPNEELQSKRTVEDIKGFVEEPEKVDEFVSACKKFGITFAQAKAPAPLKQIPIDFVGEWCNGATTGGETNWQLPSWLGEGEKCTRILSVTKYDFSFDVNGKLLSCLPDVINTKESTAPSGTSYMASIDAHCRAVGALRGHPSKLGRSGCKSAPN